MGWRWDGERFRFMLSNLADVPLRMSPTMAAMRLNLPLPLLSKFERRPALLLRMSDLPLCSCDAEVCACER